MENRPHPDRHLARIRVTVADIRRRTQAGERVDVTGLGRDINMLCEQLAAMPQDEARPYGGALETLVGDLEGIEASLRETWGSLTDRLDALSDGNDDGSTA